MGVLAEQVRAAVAADAARAWTVVDAEFWCHAEPAGHCGRMQGWKLHLSATPANALEVTRRAAGVLVEAGCAFKVALSLAQVESLVSNSSDRGAAGKVLTVYPADDAQCVALAARLHASTFGLAGPTILSDRAYVPDSLVHYRFGAFRGRTVLTNDGSYASMLIAPDGSLAPDERRGWFNPPAWAICPFGEDVAIVSGGSGVLIGDRFEIHRAIRHGSKGGVFLGADRATGAEVVVKQARPHVLGLPGSPAARDLVEHEQRMLARLAGHGVTPKPVGVFEQQGHTFAVQELIDGETLTAHIQRRFLLRRADRPRTDVLGLARRIVDTVAAVHAAGVAVRDLSPNNLMVTPDGAVVLIDLEYAGDADIPLGFAIGTPGFTAPETLAGDGPSSDADPAAADLAADRYALGAVLFHLASGVGPDLAPSDGDGYPSRLTSMVRRVAWQDAITARVAPVVLGLIAPDPTQRWDLDRVRRELADPHIDPIGAICDRVSGPELDRLIGDGVAHLVDTMAPEAARLWPLGRLHANGDPRNVQHGAAGVLAVLARAAAQDPALRTAVRVGACWLANRLEHGSRVLPGLFFGAAGAVWALHDAGRAIGDPELSVRALALAAELPLRWPNPDISHGAAGAGTAALHLWRTTGSPALEARVRSCADALVEAAQQRPHGVCWPIPADFDSGLAGLTHHGYAHGTAGIADFLLAAGRAFGEPRYRRLAHDAGHSLLGLATWDDDCAWWPTGEEADPTTPTRTAHWCSGSSGIGTFLIRLWLDTGHDTYRHAAAGAAAAVRAERWRMGTAYCHGLAGDGHYLLDLADALGEDCYREWATELGACLATRAAEHGGRLLLPDETGRGFSAAFGTGSAGALSFLMRLRDGGPRPFTIADPVPTTGGIR